MRNLPIEPPTSEIQPWYSLGGMENICELQKSCTVLYGIFTELARMIYYDTDGRLIGTPSVVWTKKGTSMWIDSELRWEDQHPEVRPAIYIQLGNIQRQPYIQGLNGKVLGADRFGHRTYEMLASGTVTFMHVASTSGEACALADNTEYALKQLQDPICKDFCFSKFESAGRLPLEKLPKEASDKYGSGVIFNFEFADVWEVKEECPILKQVNILENDVSEANVKEGLFSDPSNYAGHNTVKSDNIVTENIGSGQSR